MLKEYYELVGRYFLADPGNSEYPRRGCVISQIGRDLYLIERYCTLMDDSDWQRVTVSSKEMDNWHWYESIEEWREAYAGLVPGYRSNHQPDRNN